MNKKVKIFGNDVTISLHYQGNRQMWLVCVNGGWNCYLNEDRYFKYESKAIDYYNSFKE